MHGQLGQTIHFGPDRTYNGHSRDLPPIAEIRSGDTLSFELANSSGGQLSPRSTAEDVAKLDIRWANPTTGPIFVGGARPGDVLQVEILEAAPKDWAFTVQLPGMGLLAKEQFPDPWIHIWEFVNGRGVFTDRISIPLEPFPGVVCTAEAEPGEFPATHVPIRTGGNLDFKQVRAGSTLYLPVEVDGGLLSIGDPHCAQGDGEVCGSAIEGSIDCTIRVTIRRDLDVDAPELDITHPLERPAAAAAGYHATTGIGPDLRMAARQAIQRMVVYLERTHDLDPQRAYALCSVAVDLKVAEIVDRPNWVVSAFLPNDLFVPAA